jgi:hypothetical protein
VTEREKMRRKVSERRECDVGEIPTSLMLKELMTMIAHCLVLIQKIN